MEKTYRIVKSPELSSEYDDRYIVVDPESLKVLDDAQGYGYKSFEKAHAGYRYKVMPQSKKEEQKEKKLLVEKFIRKHKPLMRDLECMMFDSLKNHEEVTARDIHTLFKMYGLDIKDYGFNVRDFKKYM